MDRRDFLKGTSGAAALVAAGAGAAQAASHGAQAPGAAPDATASAVELVMSAPWPRKPAGYYDDALRLARRIERASEGTLRITLAGPGEGADAPLTLRHGHDRTATHPGFAYFAGLPGAAGLAPHDLRGWLEAGGGQALWDGLSEDLGVVPLLAGHTGPAPVLWSHRPISAVSDFSGLRIFTRGLAAGVVRGLGGEAVVCDDVEGERLIRAGLLDAAEWGSLAHAHAIGLPQAFAFALPGALSTSGSTLVLEIQREAWDHLNGHHRMALRAAAAAEFVTTLAEQAGSQNLIKDVVLRRGAAGSGSVESVSKSDEVRLAAVRVADAVVAHAAAHDERAARINASYMRYRQAVTEKGNIA